MGDRKSELNKFSNQLLGIYVKDLFARNDVDVKKLKERLSDEQRENLKESVLTLQAQVEEFINNQQARKTITEDSDEVQSNVSPLREKLLGKNQDQSD